MGTDSTASINRTGGAERVDIIGPLVKCLWQVDPFVLTPPQNLKITALGVFDRTEQPPEHGTLIIHVSIIPGAD